VKRFTAVQPYLQYYMDVVRRYHYTNYNISLLPNRVCIATGM